MAGQQFFVHASNKNFGSLDDIYDSLNVVKNKYYLVNQAVDVGKIDRFMQIAMFGKNSLKVQIYSLSAQPSEENFVNFIRGKIIDQSLKYYTPTNK